MTLQRDENPATIPKQIWVQRLSRQERNRLGSFPSWTSWVRIPSPALPSDDISRPLSASSPSADRGLWPGEGGRAWCPVPSTSLKPPPPASPALVSGL